MDYAFDSVGPAAGQDFYEGHSVERFIVLSAGNYVISAQQAVTTTATTFRLDDWTLIIERSQRSAG
jgi:hypothetical protein